MLVADRNIVMNTGASISGSAGNSLNVTLNSDRDASGGGSIYMQSGSSIVTNGGNIVMGGGSDPTTTAAIGIVGNPGGPHGVYLSAATVNSGTGNISLIGKGAAGTTTAIGVALDSGAIVSSSGGMISIDATAGSGIDNRGLYMAGSGTTIQSTDGAISIVGHGAAGQSSVGVMIDTGALVKSTGAATITVNGTSVGGTVINNPGVIVSGATVQSLSGSILVKGAGSGTATGAYGIWLQNGAQILSTGSAAIALDGTGSGTSAGIYSDPTGGAKTIGGSSASGAITVTSRANDLSLSNSAIQTQGDVTLTDGQASALTTTGSVSGRNISVVSDQAIFSGTVSGTTSVAYRTANNQAISFAGSFLNNVSTPLMRIGDSAMTSNISLLGAVAPSSISTLSLTTGGTISGTGAITVGALNADGGVVNLSGANSVGVLQARARSGNLFYNGAGTVTLGSVDTASNPVPGVLATGLATIAAGGDIKANFAGAYAVQGGTGAVLSAPHGAIGGATPLEVGAPSLSATAMNGINVDLNQFTPLAAGIGTLQNSGPGDIVLNAWGGMATTTLVSDPGGSVTLQTHSPLAVLGGINSGKSIFLASLGASNNVMVLDGPFTYNKVGGVFEVTIGAGGSLALAATHELLTAEVFPNALDITKFTFLGSALLDPAVNSVVITQTGFKSCKG
jgi:hypothetical protein